MAREFIVDALGTKLKGLVTGLEDLEMRRQLETIQTTALSRSAKLLSRVQETRGHMLSPNSSEKTSANAGKIKSLE